MTFPPLQCNGCKDGEEFPIPFTMAFQPIIDMGTRRIAKYEALVRGPNGEPAASVLAQVTPQNRYAFDQSCRVKAIELASGLGLDRELSINFLPNAVYNPQACIKATLDAAERYQFPLQSINFEITEDERITDTAHLLGIINEYRRHGFKVALDDFGAGFSSLNILAEMSIEVVKLDIGLVRQIDNDARRRTISLGMISVCQQLGIDVIAEGVERIEEFTILYNAGVRYFQGFLFARPQIGRLITDNEIAFPDVSA